MVPASALPQALLESLAGVPGYTAEGFCRVHSTPAPASLRLHPTKAAQLPPHLPVAAPIPWSRHGYYLSSRPQYTLNPWLHAGAYYVQEASSMFVEQALAATGLAHSPIVCLDLCAAPGGKSTHLQACLHPESVLISNEVIGQRNAILVENLTKWGGANTLVTQNDPRDFGRYGPLAHVLLIDAPCSGSGLWRREPAAIQEWSPEAVELCAQRQRRILADALPCLLPGGWLIYATCSYSPQENEAIVDWLCTTQGLQGQPIAGSSLVPGIVAATTAAAGAPVYRFFPDRVQGEGFFLALLRKKEEGTAHGIVRKPRLRYPAAPAEVPAPRHWLLSAEALTCFAIDQRIHAGNALLATVYAQLKGQFYLRKAGVALCERVQQDYTPLHDLPLSGLLAPDAFARIELSAQDALRYLRRDALPLEDAPKGWACITCQGLPLGWIKHLGNRYNNYYPKNWRIRMDLPPDVL